jgi:hypothetical protein
MRELISPNQKHWWLGGDHERNEESCNSVVVWDGNNVPARAIDGNFNTRWQADETNPIQLELGSIRSVVSLDIALYQAAPALRHPEHGAARHVRIVGQGNSIGLTEVRLRGY